MSDESTAFDPDVMDELKSELSPHQWRLLLRLGLCLGCQLAMRNELLKGWESDPFQLDPGRPFFDEDIP